ncbi:Sulfated surface-like glycoprotein [Hirschfeldia incana]|nr:Sulfated surface-like glycoprotein [Hirschfeldia incana]
MLQSSLALASERENKKKTRLWARILEMSSGWVKSWQCKSKAFDDVYNPSPIHLMSSYSCRRSTQNLKDVINTKKPKPKPKPKKREPDPVSTPSTRIRSPPLRDPLLPTLTELAEGHQSRNVVEIIFQTSWGPKPFPGRIEMIFKVQNGSKTLTRFEEYREAVKTRSLAGKSREENARSVADGNETMRFYCLGPSYGGGAWGILGGKGGGASVYTFAGSCMAHDKAGGGKGRKAMLVCRVIAGRVMKGTELRYDSVDSDVRSRFDSLSGVDGELLVFDARAVLPCFLIVYRL